MDIPLKPETTGQIHYITSDFEGSQIFKLTTGGSTTEQRHLHMADIAGNIGLEGNRCHQRKDDQKSSAQCRSVT
jgi:hypothetical protein